MSELDYILKELVGLTFSRSVIFAKYATNVEELMLLEDDDFQRMKTESGAIAARVNQLRNILHYHRKYYGRTLDMPRDQYDNILHEINDKCGQQYLAYFEKGTMAPDRPTTDQ